MNWNNENITGNEITAELYRQYGAELPVSFDIGDMDRPIPYKSSLIRFECTRCGHSITTTPKMILSSKDSIGYICSECGDKTDEQLKMNISEKMKKAGYTYADQAIEEGRVEDPNGLLKDDEELSEESERMEDYSDFEDDVMSKEEMDRLAKSEEEGNLSQESLRDYDKNEKESDKTSVEPVEEEKMESPKVKEVKNDSYDKYMENDDGDKFTLADALKNNEIVNKFKKDKKNNKEEKKMGSPKKEVEELAKEIVNEKIVNDIGEKISNSIVENYIEKEIPEEIKEKYVVAEDDVEEDTPIFEDVPVEEEVEENKDVLEPTKDTLDFSEESSSSNEDNIIPEDDDDESFTTEETVSADDDQDDDYEENDSFDDDQDDPETQQKEEEDQKIVLNGVAYSVENVIIAIQHTLNRLKFKTPLKRAPFKGIYFDKEKNSFEQESDDAIRISDTYDSILFRCDTCEKDIEVRSLESLCDNILVVDEKWCSSRGIPFKNDKYNVLQACPHCQASFLEHGYNKLCKDKIEKRFKASKLNIVDPEKYYYFNLNSEYIVEANGVQKSINFMKFVKNIPFGEDMSKNSMFEAPKKETPKSVETKQSKDSYVPLEPNREVLPEFKGDLNVYGKERTDSEDILKRAAPPKEEPVFKKGFKFKSREGEFASLNSNVNPFERKKALENEFSETEFHDFILDLSSICEVPFNLIISEKAFEIPLVDFESGIRLVCANLKERSMVNVPYLNIIDSVPFKYTKHKKNYTTIVLFSDSVKFRRQATLDALVKYINPSVLAYEGKKIDITREGLYKQYTDYSPFLADFNQKFSTYPSGKPKTGELGIVVSWEESNKITLKDAMKLSTLLSSGTGSSLESFENDYSQYMTSSIRYIEQFNKRTNRVTYRITEYIEIGSALIADGLMLCMRALLKEYANKYKQIASIPPHIVVEIDPNTYFSPSLMSYIEKGTLVPMDIFYKAQIDLKPVSPMNVQANGSLSSKPPVEQHHRYSYVRKVEYRTKDKDEMRWDMRMFQPGTLIHRMPEEIKQMGLQDQIFDNKVRTTFIYNMGFIKATQLDVKEFFVNQAIVLAIMNDSETLMLNKLPDPEGYLNTKMVTSSVNGMNVNNILLNPSTLYRYQNIMQHGTKEAQMYIQDAIMREQIAANEQFIQQQGINPNTFTGNGMGPMILNQSQMMNQMPFQNPMGMGMGNPMFPGMM